MALQHFKVLTFDVVGTLIDFERGMLDYLRSVAPKQALSDEDFLAAYRRARKSPDAIGYPDDLERCWHAVAPALGLPDMPAIARGLRDSVRDWPAFPDSVEALQRLRRRSGCRTARPSLAAFAIRCANGPRFPTRSRRCSACAGVSVSSP